MGHPFNFDIIAAQSLTLTLDERRLTPRSLELFLNAIPQDFLNRGGVDLKIVKETPGYVLALMKHLSERPI